MQPIEQGSPEMGGEEKLDISPESRQEIASRRHGSLTATVHRELEGMILRGDIAAGERLNEQMLASQLGVSRGPIREAARLLERDGLVTSLANQGVFVRQLSLEDALELYDLRAVIAQRSELSEMVSAMDRAISEDEEEVYFALNLRFHDRIAEMAGSGRTADIYTGLGKEVRLMRRRVLHGADSMRLSNEEHKDILAAIEAGDAILARGKAEHHHFNGKRRWLDTL
jgi:DNA-binding GntR family transcriptional regulator